MFGVLAYHLLRGKRWAWIVRVVLTAIGVLYVLRRDRWGVLVAATSAVELALLLTPSARRYSRAYSPPR